MKMKFKEWCRKRLVSLKRHPNHIPLLMIIICCLYYNLKLTKMSNTIATINEEGMGIIFFIIVLFSFLSIITYLSAYPIRQKPKTTSIVIVYSMLAVSVVCDAFIYYFIYYGTKLKENPIKITQARSFINDAKSMCIVHIVLIILTLIALALLPLYRKALQKINTSIKIEDVEIKEIDIEDENL